MALSWVIAGGGTGGHVTPALALGERMRARGDRVLFVGSDDGVETRLVPEAGFELLALPSRQVMGRGLLGRAVGMAAILRSVPRALRALGRVRADAVVSVGGYAAMPVVLAAALRRRPLALVCPDAVPGRVHRLSARFARRVYLGFGEAERYFAGTETRTTGNPLRSALRERVGADGERRRPAPPFRLFVFGGSQGARQLNEAMIDALPELAGLPLEVVHQTGEADRDRVEKAYAGSPVEAEVVAFERDMPSRYRWADLALSRAGALTIAELAASGLPALCCPYPHAADDHQAANAAAFEAAGAARVLPSRGPERIDGPRLAAALRELFATPDVLLRMSAAARAFDRPDAASEIVEDFAALVEGER